MACNLALGFLRDCSDSIGGIEEILISERGNFTFVEANHEVSAITQTVATNFYKYELKKEVGNFASTMTIDPANGTRFADSLLAFSINKMSAAKSNELKLMVLGQIGIIVKDNNGDYWGLGFQNYAEGQSLVANTGTAFGDRSGYDIEIMAKEPEIPYAIDSSIIAGLSVSP